MKNSQPNIALVVLALAVPACAFAQSPFQNLDFEEATFIPSPPSPPHTVSLAAALPGWTGYLGTNSVQWAYHNTKSLSGAGISIYGPELFLHGQYSVQLKYGSDPFGLREAVDAAIAQSGTIPGNARSIRFYTTGPYLSGVRVFFAGTLIPIFNLGSAPDTSYPSYIWGGDITAFANRSGELRFRGSAYLDNIQFSDEPIPEPGALAVAGLGAVLLALSRHKASHK